MFKITLISAAFIFVGIQNNFGYGQMNQQITSKFEENRYEFTFSQADYANIQSMVTFIENITVSKHLYFDNNTYKVTVVTEKTLDYNIIRGKFEKQDVELLTFEKR